MHGTTPAYHQVSLGTRAPEKEGISPKSTSLVAKLLKHLTAAHKVESHSKIIVWEWTEHHDTILANIGFGIEIFHYCPSNPILNWVLKNGQK